MFEKANAVVNGAYSIFPGVGNALYQWSRYAGLLGPEEFWRADQESRVLGIAMAEAVRHPDATLNLSIEALKAIDNAEPLFRYYVAGRALMGFSTGLGPAAAYGDTLSALSKEHNAIDAFVRGGIGGQ